MSDTQLIQCIMRMQEELVSALADVSRLISEVTKSNQSYTVPAKPFVPSSEEEYKNVTHFLFNLQKSGIINMIGADDFIQKRFGFTKAKSQDYLFSYIDNYAELEELYSRTKLDISEASSVSTTGSKKRKGPKPYAEMTPEELTEAKVKAEARLRSKSVKLDQTVLSLDVPVEAVVARKRTVIRLKKANDTTQEAHEPKPKGVLIWNAFINTVKAEMMQGKAGEEPSYNDVMKKAQELKEEDPISYRLFADNWTA